MSARPLGVLAQLCRERIAAAERDGLEIDDGNVVDLVADHCEASLADIRSALVVAGYAERFPRATSPASGYSAAARELAARTLRGWTAAPGIQWWNGLDEPERRFWLQLAGMNRGLAVPSVADAYAEYRLLADPARCEHGHPVDEGCILCEVAS